MLTTAKFVARSVGLNRRRAAAARMMLERHALATVKRNPGRTKGRILCYHSIDDASHGVNGVTSSQFKWQIETALGLGYRFVPAADIARTGGAQKDLAITFDDGRLSVDRAAAILSEYQIPWTLFVVTDWSDHSVPWARSEILTWRDIARLMRAGVEIGSHSRTHPDFARISESDAFAELASSRRAFERNLGVAPVSFAIPYGQSMNWTATAHKAAHDVGYELIYAQAEDTRHPGTIPRTFVTTFDTGRTFRAMLIGSYDNWEEWV